MGEEVERRDRVLLQAGWLVTPHRAVRVQHRPARLLDGLGLALGLGVRVWGEKLRFGLRVGVRMEG